MENELTKKFYKIREVAEILNVPQSTLRFWEGEFSECAPKRNSSNRRYYSPDDIQTLRIIKFLLKDKGLKIEAARQQLHSNKKNITKKLRIIDKLTSVKSELQSILDALTKREEI